MIHTPAYTPNQHARVLETGWFMHITIVQQNAITIQNA